jgi:hypothetical protein
MEGTGPSFFSNYTIHRRHSQRTHTYPYEYTHVNPTPRSIFKDCAGKSSRLTKSPQAPRCRREHRLPLKAQTSLNPEKSSPTGSRTQDLRCYRDSCNHYATGPFAGTGPSYMTLDLELLQVLTIRDAAALQELLRRREDHSQAATLP